MGYFKQQKKEMTIGQAEKWLEKLETLTSKGAKLLHIKNLILEAHNNALDLVGREMPKEKIYSESDFTEVEGGIVMPKIIDKEEVDTFNNLLSVLKEKLKTLREKR